MLPFWPDPAGESDDNVTALLERAAGEPIRADVLSQRTAPFERGEPFWRPGEELLHRVVLLRGATTGRAYLHGASTIAVHRLPPAVHRGLLTSDAPFGRLLRDARVRVARTDLAWIECGGDLLGALFDHPPATSGIQRSYVMRGSDERALAQIIETFPLADAARARQR